MDDGGDLDDNRVHPILFQDEMVRAILRGKKTVTRRPLKPQPFFEPYPQTKRLGAVRDGWWKWQRTKLHRHEWPLDEKTGLERYCPYGGVGDHLYVRECCALFCKTMPGFRPFKEVGESIARSHDYFTVYRAGYEDPATTVSDPHKYGATWCPSLLAPKWASRILLRVTSVRAEILARITEEEAVAEGVEAADGVPALRRFQGLWDSIHGDGQFASAPWVWVVKFSVVRKEPVRGP